VPASEKAKVGTPDARSGVPPPDKEGKLTINKTTGVEKREKLRNEYFQTEDAWTGVNEKGWFRAPRTLPLLLSLMRSKTLSGRLDPTPVYLELLARHFDGGVIEMTHEADHAYAAGYAGPRAVRSWQERMKLLEKLGFIRIKSLGNQKYRYVLIVHPTAVVERLRIKNLVSQEWLEVYRSRQMETKEASYEDRKKRTKKVISIVTTPKKKAKAG
jgi:hypothetical protein